MKSKKTFFKSQKNFFESQKKNFGSQKWEKKEKIDKK